MMIGGISKNTIRGVIDIPQTIVLLGDSLTYGNSNAPCTFTQTTGPFSWANAILGHPFNVLYNAGVGGETSTQILNRVESDVISRSPGYCMFLVGMNDGTSLQDTETLKNNIISIYNKLFNSGIYCFILTNTIAVGVVAKNNQALSVNAWMVQYFKSKPFVQVIDLFPAWSDPLTNNFTAKTNSMRDTVHPSNVGGFNGGLIVASALSRFKNKNHKVTSNSDDYFINSGSLNLLHNPLMTGSSAGTQGGTTGVKPLYYSSYCTGGSYEGSKEVRADGLGDNMVMTITANDSTCVARLESASVSYLPVVGDEIYFEVEIFIASGAVNLNRVQLKVLENTTDILGDLYPGVLSQYALPIPSSGITLTLRTSNYTYASNSVSLFYRVEACFSGAGSAVVKVGRSSCIKVAH